MPLLSALTFLPLFGALLIIVFVRYPANKKQTEVFERNVKAVTLWVSLATFALSLIVWHLFDYNFDYSSGAMQFVESHEWIKGENIGYKLGIDGISLFFILLTTFLMPLCILSSWNSVKKQVREFMISFLILESLIIGVFVSMDFVLFYFFFEASLIPMFLIIGIWGGDNRIYAAFKFFLYTLLGSVLLLLAMLYLYHTTGTAYIPDLIKKAPTLALEIQIWLWLAFFASFAVKVPMWPVHTWLPDAHVQAPTAGSMILAGVLLKLGGYGFLRFSLPMLPEASHYFVPLVLTLSAVAVIYTSLVALVQTDMKKLIAYSSIAHMGFVTAGTFILSSEGGLYAIEGAIFQMISHGIVSAALFCCVGILYERGHTKEIAYYGGVTGNMPKFAFFFLLFTMASIGLPATSGFVGEFLIMLGVFQESKLIAALIATGVILGAGYMLWLFKRVMFGEIENKDINKFKDIDKNERIVLSVLAVAAIFLGVYPDIILEGLHGSVNNLLSQVGVNQ